MSKVKLFEEFIQEGVYDPGILKAFFMAGGPGSGKSFVATEIFGFPKSEITAVSYATGLKLINNDNSFEREMKKAGFDVGELAKLAEDPDQWAEVMKIRNTAKGITKKMQGNYINGRLGQVIDGTGKDFNRVKSSRSQYRDLGYDTYMVFVNTSLEVALDRNRNRERILPDAIVKKMWADVQNNIGKFSKLFGSKNMIIVDNSELGGDVLDQIEKEIRKKINSPVANHLGKRWITDRLRDKKL